MSGAPAAGDTAPATLALDWSAYDAYGQGDAYAALPRRGAGFGKAAALCIGSRQCERDGARGLMCPSYRATHDAAHSTRARAAALRAVLDAEGDAPARFDDPALADALELCVACKGCKRECPNGVDMAALRAEALAQRWRLQAPPWRTRFFAALPAWLPRLRALRWALRWRNRSPQLARWGERWLGIAACRALPVPAARAFLASAEAAETLSASAVAASSPPDQVAGAVRPEPVLLVDCFANHLEPEVAQAALALLRAGGYRVHLLPPQAGGAGPCCGRAAFSAGFVDRAREQARGLLEALAPHLAAGRPVIGLEPSCLSMLRDEVHQLGLDPALTRGLAKNALQLEEFLARELDAGRWRPVVAMAEAGAPPAPLLVHGHCHQKAAGTLKAMRKLLAAVPGLQVEWIESGCCGMAGSFGYEAEHQTVSLAMAEQGLLPALRAAPPQARVLASGTSCRAQIRHAAGREALHLAQVLSPLATAEARP